MKSVYLPHKMISALVWFMTAAVGLMTFSSCKDSKFSYQEQVRQTYMITELRKDTTVSIAIAALDKAKMSLSLDVYGPFTFFVPDNNAFRKYFKAQGKKGLEDYSEEDLKTLMTYLILPTRLIAAQFIQGPQAVPTGRGDYITIDISKGYRTTATANGKATIYQTDIEFANGFVHKMDAVLDPPTLTIGQYLDQNKANYSVFMGGLARAGLMDTLSNLTDSRLARIRLTLFLESNDVLKKAGITTFDNMPLADLRAMMRYHIVPGAAFSASYTFETKAMAQVGVVNRWDNTLMTLDGQDWIYFNLAGSKLINNETIDLSASDVIMRNGIIHTVDKHMEFSPKLKRTQIYTVPALSPSTCYAYSIPDFNNGATPVINNSAGGNWRTYNTESTSRGQLNLLFANPNELGDSIVFVVKNVRKGKYAFEVNYKNGGSRGDFQMKYREDNIGGSINYSLGNTYEQRVKVGTYEFKTSGDKRMVFVCTRLGGLNFDCLVMTPVYD